MMRIAVSEFRARMPHYLAGVAEGQTLLLTSHGKEIAELRKPVDGKSAAAERLKQIAQTAVIGEILTPAMDKLDASR